MKSPTLALLMGLALTIASPIKADTQQLTDFRTLFSGQVRPDSEVYTLSNSDRLLPVNIVSHAGPVRVFLEAPTKLGPIQFESNGKIYDMYDTLADNRIAGLLVLKDGKVAFEDYELGIGPLTRWASFSMAKSVSSTLVAIALKQGLIASLDDPVTKYAAALKGGVYDQVSIRNLLQMASGVKWDETYTDPTSDRRHLLDIQLTQTPGGILDYMKKLSRAGAPGTIWNYSTGETFVVGAVIEGATHKTLARYLTETLWSKLGMEQDATWHLESPNGMGLAGSGFAATLRDYGRFAQFVASDGVLDGKPLVPEGWFKEAGSAHQIGEKMAPYGYQWWAPLSTDPIHKSAFLAKGIYGQFMYINPAEKLVVVELSARPKPTGAASKVIDDEAFFAAIAKALH